MKKVLVLAFLVSGFSTMAAMTDNIELQATIEGACNVNILQPSYTVNMISGETSQPISSMEVESNFVDGVELSSSFANGAAMKNGSHSIGLSALSFDGHDLLGSQPFFSNSGPTLGTPISADIVLSIPATPALSLVAGSYSETVTVTCAAVSQ